MNKEKWNFEYLDKTYKNITSENYIFKKYNIKYALLYNETITTNKVIYQDVFKLITLIMDVIILAAEKSKN